MTRFRILPYKQGSKSAKALAEALGGKVLRLEGSTYKWKSGDVVINWGASKTPEWYDTPSVVLNCNLINDPENIREVTDKLRFFQLMLEQGVSDVIPRFWTDKDSIPDDAFPVVCRTILNGHSGAGIVISPDRLSLVEAPLFTQYLKKKDEYRVHIGRQESEEVIIAVQRKARRLNHPTEDVNWQVRNHGNGFVYVREGVCPPVGVVEAAKACFRASGLDFGAVDVIWNDNKEKAYVLEINTAPGLEGQTVQDYADFFQDLVS